MSEEKQEPKPLKLKLSRSQEKPGEASPNPGQTQSERGEEGAPGKQPGLKLKRESGPESTPAAKSPPVEPDVPKANPGEESGDPPPDAAPRPLSGPEEGEPQGEVESAAGENEDPFQVGPRSSSKLKMKPTAPAVDDTAEEAELSSRSGGAVSSSERDALESSIRRVSEPATSHSVLPSVLLFFLLAAILGGAGYGLWYVLQDSGPDTKEASAAAAASAPEAPVERPAEKSGGLTDSIRKAREAVGSVPTAALEEVIGTEKADTVRPPADVSEKRPPEAEAAAAARPQAPVAPEPPQPEPAQVDRSLVDAVSAYLAGAHVGGVRTGDRPMVIIGGISYELGDLVDAATGLRFSGLRDGKLAFTDANGVIYLKSF